MENYIASLEKEFSLIENGFKEEEKRALSDYRSNDKEFVKKLAFLAYNSNTYQVRMYGVFLFGYLSEQNDILTFMRDEVSKDDNWRVQEVLAKAFDEFSKLKKNDLLAKFPNFILNEIKMSLITEKEQLSALRWICRGLPQHIAIHKVKVDIEISKNANKYKKQTIKIHFNTFYR